jgi:uncharacterized protein with PIN domain
MVTATFRFHHELNNFLVPGRRGREFSVPCARNATTKHMIEALGVPHTEVALLTVQDQVAGLDRLLQDGDHVAVYPHGGLPDTAQQSRVRARDPAENRFVADAHLGGLARLLRMSGFDTLYSNELRDREIADIALREHRIVLTRDRDLLMLRDITDGCYLHALKPEQQFVEIMSRFMLADSIRPFSRCLECNAPLQAIAKSLVQPRLPPAVQTSHEHFTHCRLCGRVYWKGSHWQHMQHVLEVAVRQSTFWTYS